MGEKDGVYKKESEGVCVCVCEREREMFCEKE